MTQEALTTKGIELWLAPAGGTLVKVAELINCNPPSITRDTIDVTTHDSSGDASEFVSDGVYERGDIKADIHYIPGSAGDTAIILALTTGALQDVKIVVKSAGGAEKLEGAALVTEYAPATMEVKGKQMASLTLKPSGVWTQQADS